MGVVYYGLNLKTICVEHTDVVFGLQYDYFDKRLAKPTYRLSDVGVIIEGKEYIPIGYSLDLHAQHSDLLIRITLPTLPSEKFTWRFSGKIISEYSDAQKNSSLDFDYQGTYDKKWESIREK